MIERIGKYEIQAELGRGGFGRVYRAHDPGVNRLVAIKVLTSEGDPDLLGRFRAEAGTTGNLIHKNIVTVYDYGEHNGMPYLVMELLEGQNFYQIIHTGKPFSLLEKVGMMSQVAEGLHAAHLRGVVHRDVKPSNIMLLPDGNVKIMDFGIARVMGQSTTRRTRKGDLLGTILYMAPEPTSLATPLSTTNC
jgi:serine/threonine-protein kinase